MDRDIVNDREITISLEYFLPTELAKYDIVTPASRFKYLHYCYVCFLSDHSIPLEYTLLAMRYSENATRDKV